MQKAQATEAEDLFTGGGEMAALMRSLDWSQTGLGPVETWSQSLKTAVRIMLTSRQAMFVWWGENLINLYNDAYRSILGGKHPEALGQPAAIVWREIWDQVGPRAESALSNNEGTYDEALLLIMERNGYPEETYYTFSYSPIPDDESHTSGIICANTDDTQRIISERQLALLRELAAKTADARTFDEACTRSASCLETNLYDLPFAMIYLVDPDQQHVVLAGTSGIDRHHPAVPGIVDLNVDSIWSFNQVIQTQKPVLISDLVAQFGSLPTGAWDRTPHQATVVPIAPSGQTGRSGILVAGLNPLRLFDDNYRSFIDLVAGQISASIANANAYEEERKRAEALAELDRAKTAFFSNISHEFRTPLTLILSPLEELSTTLDDRLQPDEREQLQLIQRNGSRLQKLVNTLLDFSRIEAGRVQASYEPTDLATYTAELASVFRSLIERAGMSLAIDCPPLPEPVYVDREMWEKIVLNLISNAFKFTFDGSITVRLHPVGHSVELSIADTGVGIPEAELPRLFERFHRVSGARSRTYEGSGIGLALVQELVKLHGGTIRVTSQPEQGTTFTITLPFGSAHLPSDRIQATRTLTSTALGADSYLIEALRWLPEESAEFSGLSAELSSKPAIQTSNLKPQNPQTAHILLVEDNADMRAYIKRLLSQYWDVETASDGLAALDAIAQRLPDLVLSDVMMPRLDGFGLLRELRGNPRTQEIPIILLSARAGEESRIEGLEAGADDYLTKPFSARELLARVEATLKLAQLRRETTQREQALRLDAENTQQAIETILSSINDGFYTLDRDWRYIYVNDRYCEMTGLEREALLGRNLWEVFADTVGTDVHLQFQQAMREQTPLHFEYLYAAWNRWYDHRIYPSPKGLTVFTVEITRRKRIEAEREQLLAREQAARAEAERANRVKDEFLAIVSHELRSPLNPILGWATLLQTRNLDEERTAQALATVERNARLQAELIDDLLDVSRILRGKLSLNISPVNLETTIQAAIGTVQLAAEAKRIELRFEVSEGVREWESEGVGESATTPSPIQVMGDAARLQQVIWNLLSNAVKFTPQGGRVEVRLERVESEGVREWESDGVGEYATAPSPQRPITPSPRHSYAQITVTDTGKGIHPNFLAHVFDYFRQEDGATTRQFGGLGLGLAIVRHLVELHGGTVQVDSPGEGQGATFTVRLPLLQRTEDRGLTAQPSVLSTQHSALSTPLTGLHILIVDDDADTRDFVAFLLEQAGARVATFASASETIAALVHSKPDVLLSDIGMPETDGYMLMRQVRALSPEQGGKVPAIALTAYAGEIDYQQAMAAGFQRHIAKPVDPAKLVEAIATLVETDKY